MERSAWTAFGLSLGGDGIALRVAIGAGAGLLVGLVAGEQRSGRGG